jgi:hypothetical protein
MAISINTPISINGSTRFGGSPNAPTTMEYLIVAGGGGGGYSDYNSGGGGGGSSPYSTGAAGGSGVVIVRHSNIFRQATVTGSPTITTSGGYIIYKFTGSGTIQWS